MNDLKSVQLGNWKVTVLSGEYLRFKNVKTGVTGRIRLEHDCIDWYDGVYELPTDVYRCLELLDIGFDSHA